MIELYYWPTPNGHKITLFLEEAALPYRIIPVDIGAGDQFKAEFLALSPNNRMPAIVDPAPADGGEPIGRRERRRLRPRRGPVPDRGAGDGACRREGGQHPLALLRRHGAAQTLVIRRPRASARGL